MYEITNPSKQKTIAHPTILETVFP